jgi:undecaprenyl-diphosphatase
LAGSLLDFTGERAKVFEIAIQTGAMFAVMWEYRARLKSTLCGIGSQAVAQRFAMNLLVAFIPAAVFGFLLGSWVKHALFHPVPVACAFIVGGLIILWVERRHRRKYGDLDLEGTRRARVETVDDMSVGDALKVGLVQCLALIPGTSRSGATIIGAMLMGFSRKCATEFSFFLGIPTLVAAGAYSLIKQRHALQVSDAPMFAVGLVFAFFSALFCIRWLIRYVSTHDFTLFAWYRIVFGGIVLLTAYTGWVEWSA